MNFFSKNRLVFWLLIFLVVINLTALTTFLVFYSRHSNASTQQSRENPGILFRKELSLSPSQSEKVEVILADYRKSTEPVTTNIRNYRSQLLEELAKDKPDTSLLNICADEICLLQKQLQKASVKQYIALKEICNPAQCERLSALYFELYGCQGQGKGIGKGKGMMHRYRRGQGQQGRGNMMENDSCAK
ncbi:MAG: periplasmic heavy metal sensor [Bacteroidetes bacterium]|nr:periplasmic heavy metal sensor [Bacteroidota bacterium]